MSIDAQVQTVIVNEDGSGELRLIDRPARRPGDYPGCRGQSVLQYKTAPEEVTALNGLCIWGGSETIMLGDRKIADRIGYVRIAFVESEAFKAAVTEYHRMRRRVEVG
jgi:hypothetical protein